MLQIVLCEDSETQRKLLGELLEQHFADKQEEIHIHEYECGETLVADVEKDRVCMDLLFLDINLGKMNGMEVARKLRELGCKVPIIFMTATAEYAVEGYEVGAAGYLLKPYEKSKIEETVERILKRNEQRRIVFKSKRQRRYVNLNDIMYIESDKHAICVHLMDGTDIDTTGKLGEIEKMINEDRFLRCHQSYLVNMDYIQDIRESFILSDGTNVPIRVRGRKDMTERYFEYFSEHAGK